MNKLSSLAVAVAFGFAGHAFAADNTGMTKDAYKEAKDKIEAQYKSDKASCDGMKGNAKDVCKAEAKGKEKVAKAELEAQYKPTAHNEEKAKMAKADADYAVAKEKCEDQKGSAKSACKKDAKTAHDNAKSQAKADAKAAAPADKKS